MMDIKHIYEELYEEERLRKVHAKWRSIIFHVLIASAWAWLIKEAILEVV